MQAAAPDRHGDRRLAGLDHGQADVALQAAVASAPGLRKRPDQKKLAKIGERWRPWRSVAARLFWRHYRTVQDKKRAAERAKGCYSEFSG